MCVEISHMHSNNGIFSSGQFRLECENKNKGQYFSVVGSQNQNKRSKRAIQTIMYMVRSFMFHSYLHWSDHVVDNIYLWYFAIKHAVWFLNHFPNYRSGITPLELITRNNADHLNFSIPHVQVCPVFVLDPKIKID